MRIITFVASAAAILALSSTAALAGNDTTNIQVGNGRALSAITVGVDLTAVGSGDASSLAVGNLVSVGSPYPAPSGPCSGTANYGKPVCTNDTAFASFQSSVGSILNSGVNLSNVNVGADLTGAAQAINNHGSFSSDTGRLTVKTWQDATVSGTGDLPTDNHALNVALAYNEATAIQLGDNTRLDASFVGADLTTQGAFDGSSLAVGNNLSFKAHANTSAIAFQTGDNNVLVSLTSVDTLNAAGNASLNATAINNNASWQTKVGAADGINFQYGSNAAISANVNLNTANIGGNLNIGSVAAGNIAQIGNY